MLVNYITTRTVNDHWIARPVKLHLYHSHDICTIFLIMKRNITTMLNKTLRKELKQTQSNYWNAVLYSRIDKTNNVTEKLDFKDNWNEYYLMALLLIVHT